MSEKKFNWVEKILDNDKLSLHVRATFGVGLIFGLATIIGGLVWAFKSFEISPAWAFGTFGVGCWYFMFYKACAWSDEIKNRED